MNVNPGELNKRIQIILRTEIPNGNGYPEVQETVVHSCWAKFTQISGMETFRANADFGEEKARFLIRYTSKPINRKMFVRYAGSDYEIQYINDYGDSHEYIEIWCKWRSLEGRP